MLTKEQLLPCALELRDTVDAALYRLSRIEQLAGEWLAIGKAWQDSPPRSPTSLAEWGPLQSQTFDELEGFLAAYARVSLLVFPISRAAAERGQSIRSIIGLGEESLINNRDLRDSWMHHDERMDEAIASGRGLTRQRFTLATAVTPDEMKNCLRLIEMDTLVVHYRDRGGTAKQTALRELRAALEDLDHRRKALF